MKFVFNALLILICIVALTDCKAETDSTQHIQYAESHASEVNEPPASESPTIPPAGIFRILGTITYKNIERGFYAIDSDDGKRFDPVNLPESFRRNGLKVIVSARVKQDITSFHMYGVIIEIVNIEAR